MSRWPEVKEKWIQARTCALSELYPNYGAQGTYLLTDGLTDWRMYVQTYLRKCVWKYVRVFMSALYLRMKMFSWLLEEFAKAVWMKLPMKHFVNSDISPWCSRSCASSILRVSRQVLSTIFRLLCYTYWLDIIVCLFVYLLVLLVVDHFI